MELYHGSDIAIEHPIVQANRGFADLGRGFYLTDDRDVAVSRAKMRARGMGASAGVVSVFSFNLDTLDWVTWDGASAVEPAADAATREDAAVDPVPEAPSVPEQPFCLRFDQDEAGIIGWLEYVKECRSGRTALEGKGDPAIVRAWIATMETEMVCSGFASAADLASLMKPEQLIVQYCFRTQDAIDSHLVFVSSFEIPL